MKPESSLSHSQETATCPYPEPHWSSPCPQHTSRRSILISSSHLRLGLNPLAMPTIIFFVVESISSIRWSRTVAIQIDPDYASIPLDWYILILSSHLLLVLSSVSNYIWIKNKLVQWFHGVAKKYCVYFERSVLSSLRQSRSYVKNCVKIRPYG